MPQAELKAEEITLTLERLLGRIENRFPGSSLSGVCSELLELSRDTSKVMDWVVKPILWIRVSIVVFLVVVAMALLYSLSRIRLEFTSLSLPDLVQALEATTSEIVLIAAGLFSLATIENRVKRARVISAINGLRAQAHIIDMHQLTKDPDNPKRELDDVQLGRYLDYCSEMLALVSKIGFLYVNRFDDPQANTAVNELETLTNGLSRKIWQKISILNQRRISEHGVSAKASEAINTVGG